MYKNPNRSQTAALKAQNPDDVVITIDGKNLYVTNGLGASHTSIMRTFGIKGDVDLILKRNGELVLVDTQECVEPTEFGNKRLEKFVNNFKK